MTKILRSWLLVLLTACLMNGQTGTGAPSLADFDSLMSGLLTKYSIPGGSMAVSYRGRLVYARGFGVADRDTGELVQPDSVFRVASVSKPLTMIGIMRLVEQGRVRLDDKVFGQHLRSLTAPPNLVKQAVYDDITVRQLLQHTAGLPSTDNTVDPFFAPRYQQVTQAFGGTGIPTLEQMLRWQITRPLGSTPGAQFNYSNMGLAAAGRVIEAASGKKYEAFLREDVLGPLGITKTRAGRTRLADRTPGEVRYHMPAGATTEASQFGEGQVFRPYSGAFSLELLEGAATWITTSVDLVRIASRLNAVAPGALITRDSFAEIIRRPPAPLSQTTNSFYGLGFNVELEGQSQARLIHNGSLPGTRSVLFRFGTLDVCVAAAFNMRVATELDDDFIGELYSGIRTAANRNRQWPEQDLWGVYYAQDRPRFTAASVVSAASFRGGSIAPGQIITLFGERLAGAALTTAQVNNGRLSTSLDGTRLLFDGTAAPLVYTSAGQLSAIVPYNVAGKARVRVVLERLGVQSDPVEMTVVEAAPAIFTANASGTGPAAVITYPEARIAVLFATGEGLTNPGAEDGALALTQPLPAPRLPVKVLLAGREAKVLYAGAAPGLTAGLFQLNIEVPEDLAATANLPVVLEVGSQRSIAGVTLSLR
jgi:uncharacterized protein (TIGR03437 family)